MTPQGYPLPSKAPPGGAPPPAELSPDPYASPRRWRDQLRQATAFGLGFLAHSADTEGLQSTLSTTKTPPRALAWRKRKAEPAEDVGKFSETLTSALALKHLYAVLPAPLHGLLLRWVGQNQQQGPPRFHLFGDVRGGAPDIDVSGLALVGLWRAEALDRATLRGGAAQLLRSAKPSAGRGFQEEGLLQTHWHDGNENTVRHRSESLDAVAIVDALHAILMAVRVAQFSLEQFVVATEDRPHGGRYERRLRGADVVQQNLEYLRHHLDSNSFHGGSPSYPGPEVFLALATDLWRDTVPFAAGLREPLCRAVTSWWHTTRANINSQTPVELASMIIAADNLRLPDLNAQPLKEELCAMQESDGSWAAANYLRLETPSVDFGSRELSTVLALRALTGAPRTGTSRRSRHD